MGVSDGNVILATAAATQKLAQGGGKWVDLIGNQE
jgi:hypothetical protein